MGGLATWKRRDAAQSLGDLRIARGEPSDTVPLLRQPHGRHDTKILGMRRGHAAISLLACLTVVLAFSTRDLSRKPNQGTIEMALWGTDCIDTDSYTICLDHLARTHTGIVSAHLRRAKDA